MDTYNRPALMREAVSAFLRQTYQNLEIILISNGAVPEAVEYLHEVAGQDKRVKRIHFKENQYIPGRPLRYLEICENAALEIATGDYVWYQADDDLIADDYMEKMVALFEGNPDCITAAGVPVGIDVHGRIIEKGMRVTNFRPRYMPGHLLARDVIREGRTMFDAPGTIFTIKREVLVKAGGYHGVTELSQLYGIVPFGVTGFDETAVFYWRRHEGQLNKQLTANGQLGIDETFELLRDWEIERRWRVFGANTAREVVVGIENNLCDIAAHWFAVNLLSLRYRACLRILRSIGSRARFWGRVPGSLWKLRKEVKLLFKPPIRLLFKLLPALANLSPKLARLHDRASR